MSKQVELKAELHSLLAKALELADEANLARLHHVLLCLSEGADLVDYSCDVPEGLEHKPIFKRMLQSRNLLDAQAIGHA